MAGTTFDMNRFSLGSLADDGNRNADARAKEYHEDEDDEEDDASDDR